MVLNRKSRIAFLLPITIVLCGILFLNKVVFAQKTLDPASVAPIEINALIMGVNIEASHMIIAEQKITITEFKIGDMLYKTALLDEKGNSIGLTSFAKGDRVQVRAFKLPDGLIVAGIVQKVSSR